jgi:bifunctional UDP-N-acetylglucosamine pyrophosphorylase/glucosamine-1-phosphate N-acetyltransferase
MLVLIPAAGKGSRLGSSLPKLLTLVKGKPIISHILNSIDSLATEIQIIVSPTVFKDYGHKILKLDHRIKLLLQEIPKGMGDAIFGNHKYWKHSEKIVLIWGDQILVQKKTLMRVITFLNNGSDLVIPLCEVKTPYVQYKFDEEGILNISQQREGDVVDSVGYSDVGVFGFKTQDLKILWDAYSKVMKVGNLTKEVNFLPFLEFISTNKLSVNYFKTDFSWECLGINTRSDILYAETIFDQIQGHKL